MGDREEFLQIFQQHVTRPGSEKLLDWLDNKTDFFSAPASTRFHGACEGGLCMHSLNVYHALHDTFFTEGDSEESFAISEAYDKYPLAVKLHIADLEATYLMEHRTSAVK